MTEIKTPAASYTVASITTRDHKKCCEAKEIYHRAKIAGYTQEDIYFKGLLVVQEELNKEA